MKRIFAAIILVALAQTIFAKTDGYVVPHISGEFARKAVTDTLCDTIYDQEVLLKNGNLRPDGDRYKFTRKEITLTLCVNPNNAEPPANSFTSSVECVLLYKETPSGSIQQKIVPLTINYNPNAGSAYKAKDVYVLKGAVWARIKTINKTVLSIPESDNSLQLNFQYSADKFFPATVTQSPVVNSFIPSKNNGFLRLQWNSLPWAERYDMEWLFVDNYDGTLTGEKPASQIAYDFRHNNTRVTTQNTEVEIPMVFERGYVLARVRAVGVAGEKFDELQYGKWSAFETNSGTGIPVSSNSVFKVTAALAHEGDKMNWQYTGAFAGDDLHKESVTYMDGTLRQRQLVSSAQSDLNLLVAETIYDHQGRTAIQTLPAPVKPLTPTVSSTVTLGGGNGNPFQPQLSLPNVLLGTVLDVSNILELFSYSTQHPKIGYQKNFNRNTDEQPYSKNDFDLDAGGCNVSTEPFSANSGAGKYYSPNNDDKTGFNQFIPDAQGYPFTQITYTPDKTGRASSVSKAGVDLRKGGGHETKMFYGTPAQDELDRMFGNDAGNASRYKKEMLIDENGQAHVSYKDIRGNVIATALTGEAPEAYTPVPHGSDFNITLHLIEEDNRVDVATNSLVSQKSLLLGKRTNVTFSYSLTPPSFNGTYCDLSSLCYDCIYDLTIDVRNDCGEVAWHEKQRIGNLSALNTCSAAPVNFSRTVVLNPGNYFISKRLTVNDSAIVVYVNDYKSHFCAMPLDPFVGTVTGNPCVNVCNTCPQTTRTQTFSKRTASGPHPIDLMVQMRGANDGSCVRYCNTGPASVCATALESMLADVSPGGQYGEYLDTTNREFPLGILDPSRFPLSVFNPSNELPIMNASWQIPAFDYQNRDGSTAYIEIGPDNLPSHSERDVIVRDGKRYVKPAYLNDVHDFIHYWQSQWAEALVAYHPEYPYYMWCLYMKESTSYDSTMRNTATYAEARGKNLINHRALSCANDPFFRSPSPRTTAMNNVLQHYTPLTGFGDLNIEEAVYLAVNYNNVNASAADINANVRRSLYAFSEEVSNKQWTFYREFYLVKKQRLYDATRREWILASSFFDNSQIGTNSFGTVPNPLYAEKTKRFIDAQDALTYLPIDVDTITLTELNALRDVATQRMQQTCGGCGISYELLAFFNALALEKKLKQATINLPDVTPVILSKAIVETFTNRTALQYRWQAAVTTSDIRYEIFAGADKQCTINLHRDFTRFDWDSIVRFDCFSAVNTNEFTLSGHTNDGTTILITGSSTCMNFRDCPAATRVCTKEPAADEMAVLMQYLFQRNRYRSTYLVLRDRTGYSPHFGEALRAYLPTATRYAWKMNSISTAEDSLNAIIRIYGPGIPESAGCPVTLKVITTGFRLNQVAAIVDISKPVTTACSVNEFILTARTATGERFQIRGTSCYVLFRCCHNNNAHTPSGICCITPTPPVENSPLCGVQADAIRENNRRYAEDEAATARADSLYAKLVKHCLAAAETFNAVYSDAIYQITLMYYDRSNQLVKAVSPREVILATPTQIAQTRNHRAHTGYAYYPVYSPSAVTAYQYNSFNQVIQKTLPDEGTTRYCYDQNGRVIMTQDATQLTANACSYTLYDNNGRTVEGGRRNYSGAIPSHNDYGIYTLTLPTSRTEVTKTTYDIMPGSGTSYFAGSRKNLRNRVTAISREENLGTVDHAMYFDYDVLGNARNVVQQFTKVKSLAGSAFAAPGSDVKTINYQYNQLTGKVKRVWYQPGKADQFIHWYQYDEDGRMVKVQTGTNPNEMEMLRETDARYYYYAHGPLARIELGSEKIQGIDYAYTINGLLKSINSGSGAANDMGKDGRDEPGVGRFMPDVFGEELNYFENDYTAITDGTTDAVDFSVQTSGDINNGFSKPLYNGFIRNTISSLYFPGLSSGERMAARAFKYDQAARLTDMKMIFANPESNSIAAAFTDDFNYKMHLHYDANGNIDTLIRKKKNADMDELVYTYTSGNNQLQRISDRFGSSSTDNDLGNKTYSYDVCGRLTNDGSNPLTWNNAGLLKQYGSNNYCYSAMGKRTWKQTSSGIEFYVNDSTGNTLASYQINGSELRVEDLNIFGGSRLGAYHLSKVVNDLSVDAARDSFSRGLKRYEITNHIGDVQVVLSDKRVRTTGGTTTDIISATDYYPFGMVMPGRSFGARDYRYGYQGMECDDEAFVGGDNEYTTEFRQYDPRVGRWMSVDPKADKFFAYTPYNAMLNNPILFTDSKGADPISDNPRRVRTEDDRLLAEMEEWGDDPIAGIEEESLAMLGEGEVDGIERLGITLDRLEGNDDPLAGLPYEVTEIATPSEPTHRRHRGGTARILREDLVFEDDHVHGRRSTGTSTSPSTTPPPPGEDWERDGRIVREALGNAGTVMDVGGVVGDGVNIYEMTREGLSVREGADVLMRGSRTVGGMSLLGAGISTANMVGDIWDDANALVDGDIGTGTYVGRSALNITSGVVGCVPVVGVVGSRALGAFRDWALPRPAH